MEPVTGKTDTGIRFAITLALDNGENKVYLLGEGDLLLGETNGPNFLKDSNIPQALRQIADTMETGTYL